jgi:beta-lactamase class A
MSGLYSCRSRRPRRGQRAWLLLVALMTAAVLAGAACSSPSASTPQGPATPAAPTSAPTAAIPPDVAARAQLEWLIAAMAHLPVSEAQARVHINAAVLEVVDTASLNEWLRGVNEWLETATGPKVDSIKAGEPGTVFAIISAGGTGQRARVIVTVDSRGMISSLDFSPAVTAAVPTTWSEVDADMRSVAPRVRLLVANVTDGSCQPVHSIDADTAAQIGSVFKLYVLDALGNAVAADRFGWDQPLTVTAQFKSLPSGVLQNEPDGTQISVRDAAGKMISISDNTAADMLINLVGRSEVEATLTSTGMADPALNRPFLTTRETSILMLTQWPTLAKRYLAADEAGRRALLANTVDRLPLPTIAEAQALNTRRGIAGLGYFASANDICRVYISLADLARRPDLSPVGQALSFNDAGLELDPAQWKTTWFKGGVGPGALALAFMATTHAGQSYVVIALAENPSKPIDDLKAAPVMFAAVKGAFTLAARG